MLEPADRFAIWERPSACRAAGRAFIAVLEEKDERKALTDRKETLERELAALLPGRKLLNEADAVGPKGLAQCLPKQSVFIDLIRHATTLRQLVWDPVATHVPPDVTVVLMARDTPLPNHIDLRDAFAGLPPSKGLPRPRDAENAKCLPFGLNTGPQSAV